MDFDLADVDGIEGARRIKAAHPGVRVLLLTGLADLDLLVRAAAAQVDGFLTKDTPLEQLLEAVRGEGDGDVGLVLDAASIEALRRRVGDVATIGGRSWLPALTAREKEVLALLEAGVEPKSIAAQLGIRLHTCRGYVRNVLVKLGAHSQLEAVAVARRAGLLS
jgi:DNA-binding NarL/FixJ family response regulator